MFEKSTVFNAAILYRETGVHLECDISKLDNLRSEPDKVLTGIDNFLDGGNQQECKNPILHLKIMHFG